MEKNTTAFALRLDYKDWELVRDLAYQMSVETKQRVSQNTIFCQLIKIGLKHQEEINDSNNPKPKENGK